MNYNAVSNFILAGICGKSLEQFIRPLLFSFLCIITLTYVEDNILSVIILCNVVVNE